MKSLGRPVKEGFFHHSGMRMRYLEMGEGEPVLFLHGAFIDASVYQEVFELLASKYFVIVPDLPGFGGSSVPKKVWDFTDYAYFFDKFVKSLKLDNITLIGHSFGGGIAFNLAAINKKISRLILIDAAGIPADCSEWSLYFSIFFKKTLADFFLYNKIITLRMMGSFFVNLCRNFFQYPLIIKILRRACFKEYPRLNQIKAPTLILWGDKDELVSRKIAHLFHQRIKNSQLKFVSGNHDWLFFRPQIFRKELDQFLLSNSELS